MASWTSLELIHSFIWLKTIDGPTVTVPVKITEVSTLLHRERYHNNRGFSEDSAIVLPSEVDPRMLEQILEYCRFHEAPGRSDHERKDFDVRFIKLHERKDTLAKLLSAARSLGMQQLTNLAESAVAAIILELRTEVAREALHGPIDLTVEEELVLEPITDDPQAKMRYRMRKNLLARKRREGQEEQRREDEGALVGQRSSVQDGHRDDRSIDDLVSFVGGSGPDEKGTGRTKSKKKEIAEASSLAESPESSTQRTHSTDNAQKSKKKEKAEASSLAESPESSTQRTHSTDNAQQTDNLRDSQEVQAIGETKSTNSKKKNKKKKKRNKKKEQGRDSSLAESVENQTQSTHSTHDGVPDRMAEVMESPEDRTPSAHSINDTPTHTPETTEEIIDWLIITSLDYPTP